MLLTEYNEEKILANRKKEGIKEGEEIGMKKGKQEKAVEVATRMIRKGFDIKIIVEMTQLPEKKIAELANQVKSESD